MPGSSRWPRIYYLSLLCFWLKHVIARTARESWLGIMCYKFYTLYLQKYAPVQIFCLEQRDNDFCCLADVPPPTMRIQGRNSWTKMKQNVKQVPWASELHGFEIRNTETSAKESSSPAVPEALSAPQWAQPPMWPVRIKLLHTIKAEGCLLTD